jgi:acetylornithine/N-succinyldiaminopimelate aminotransferase
MNDNSKAASQTADPAVSIKACHGEYVVPSYGRFDLVFTHGTGSHLFDTRGRRYLDLSSGIAVCALGHAHPRISDALVRQSRRLVHISNLYYHELQGQLAQALVQLVGAGKCFFANSGAEANEGLFKLARKFGHDEGRFEVLTTLNSFHGRTLAGIAATGQDKVKKGFEPLTPGFRHIAYNNLAAMASAVSPATVAIMIEGVQGEGGVTPADPDYLMGLRQLCNEQRLMLLMDGVQCGHFRTGRFQSFHRILENTAHADAFLPDGISMAKALGGGFPIGAFWVRAPYADLLGPGTHASTFGGTPLACAVALEVLQVIQEENLADNARSVGNVLKAGLQQLASAYPNIIQEVRGLGLMIGFELNPKIPAFGGSEKSPSIQMVCRLHDLGLLTVPAGQHVVRLLPPLNLSRAEAQTGLNLIEKTVVELAKQT